MDSGVDRALSSRDVDLDANSSAAWDDEFLSVRELHEDSLLWVNGTDVQNVSCGWFCSSVLLCGGLDSFRNRVGVDRGQSRHGSCGGLSKKSNLNGLTSGQDSVKCDAPTENFNPDVCWSHSLKHSLCTTNGASE